MRRVALVIQLFENKIKKNALIPKESEIKMN
jgi:hypothetical protein